MKNTLSTLILTLLTVCCYAQDVIIDLTTQNPTSGSHVTVSASGVTLDFDQAASPNTGAYVGDWECYWLKLTSTCGKNIAVVEFDGGATKSKYTKPTDVQVQRGGGQLTHNPESISVWEGNSPEVYFYSPQGNCYIVQRIRVWFEGSTYVPTTPGGGGTGGGGDIIEETPMGAPIVRTLSVPQDGKAVKMAIVTIKEFSDLAQEYALWKTQQGYDVTEVYADDYIDPTLTEDANAHRIQARLKEICPAFVLIMGDYEHVPAFDGTKFYNKGTYVTDYFYGEYTGDYFPEAYVGRFSCYEAADIRNQMEKTQYMAWLPASQGDWLNTSVGLHNPSSDISTAEGYDYTMNYLRKFNATIKETSASTPNTVNNYINEGCATLTYFGHGLVTSFNGSYMITDARKLSNDGKYPLVIGMTCLTGKFDNGHYRDVLCLGEQMQRLKNAGSVAFIGATRESGDRSNICFMTGGNKRGQSYPGFLGSMFPLTPEDPLNVHARTLGEAVAMGCYSINCYVQASVQEATEWTELFGDPTYQPYVQTPKTMTVTQEGEAVAGHLLKVQAEPNTVVCISKDRHIWAVGLTDDKGYVTLKINKEAEAGDAVLYASAPGYTDWKRTIQIAPNDGREEYLPEATPALNPVLQATDVIDHTTANTIADQWKAETVRGESGAVYATWVSGDRTFECVNMRNNYERCGIVTTQSGGYVRKVSVDWTLPNGTIDSLSVYGSNTPYLEPSDVWNDNKKGHLLGQIIKGQNNSIVIPSNYAYVALRAENLDCMMQSIRIGWGTEVFEVEGGDKYQPSAFDFDEFKRHRVLVEKFTGQYCQYCASDDATLNTYIAENDVEDKMYELRYYTYSNDRLSMPVEPFNVMLRPWGISGHPSYMVDRCGYDGTTYINCGFTTRAQTIKNLDWVNNRYNRPCRVSLSLDGSTYNPATRELKVVVSGKALPELVDLRVNLFVAQNGIIAYQSGGSSTYEHNGVSRAFLTADAFGDKFDVREDGVFQVEKSYTLPESIGNIATDADKMDIVAFISSWDDYSYPPRNNDDDKDFENCEVHNTLTARISSLPFYAMPPSLPNLPGQETVTPGDVNGDHQLNVADLTTLVNIILGTVNDPQAVSAADLNHDGEVRVDDYTLLVQMILSGATLEP